MKKLNKEGLHKKKRTGMFWDRDRKQEFLVWAIQKQYKALLYDGNHV